MSETMNKAGSVVPFDKEEDVLAEEISEIFESNKTLQSEFCRLNDSQFKERLNKMFKAWLDTMGNEHCNIVMDLQVAALNNIVATDVMEVFKFVIGVGWLDNVGFFDEKYKGWMNRDLPSEKDEGRDYVSGLDAKTTQSPEYSKTQDKYSGYGKGVVKKAENSGVSITIKTKVFPNNYAGGKIDTKKLAAGPEYLLEATWEQLVLIKRALKSKVDGDTISFSFPMLPSGDLDRTAGIWNHLLKEV